jgi:hypothetical protein
MMRVKAGCDKKFNMITEVYFFSVNVCSEYKSTIYTVAK